MKDRKQALQILAAVLAAISEAGETGISSGHLYAMVMGVLSLDQYQAVINELKDLDLVKESNYLLTAN